MTLGIYKLENNNIKLSEQGHCTEWSVEIEPSQLDYVINKLSQYRDEINTVTIPA